MLLTVCTSLIRSRHVVRAVEFTKLQVRLETRAYVLTVHIDDVRAVRIEHTGDTDSGYQRTFLRLEWLYGGAGMDGVVLVETIVRHHDPALGEALLRLYPSHVAVTERWDQLQEPSTG